MNASCTIRSSLCLAAVAGIALASGAAFSGEFQNFGRDSVYALGERVASTGEAGLNVRTVSVNNTEAKLVLGRASGPALLPSGNPGEIVGTAAADRTPLVASGHDVNFLGRR